MKLFTCYVLSFYKGKDENDSSCNISPTLTRHIIMRIQAVIFLLLFTCLNISAKVYAQKVTLHLKQQPLEKAFLEIEKATGMAFFGPASLIEKSKPVTVQLTAVSLEEALKAIFKDQPLTYEIIGKMIKIMEKPVAVPIKTPPIRVRGKVTDINNKPLPAVSIRVRGTNVGTVTDQDGDYVIDAEPDAILLFTCVGFQAMQIKVNGQSEHNLTMVENEAQLNETVIKGYYATTKELNTGNVSSLKAADIAKQPVSDPIMALQGRIPGLNINQTSGVPGAGISVNIRGRNSLSNGNNPLYIIDGIPFSSERLNQNPNAADRSNNGLSPFTSIRPEDIESIDVLKDADATAIYGSRGANGVILITTKKGRSGKTTIDANINSGLGKVTRTLELMNTAQYLEMRMEAFKNDNINPGNLDYDVNGTWTKDRYTDWQKEIIGGTAHMTNASASISGGNANTQFLLGSSYRKETTVYPGDYAYQIGSANLNVNHTSENKKFRADLSANYSVNKNRLPTSDLTSFTTLAPNTPLLYKANGDLNFENGTFDNPLRLLNQKSTSVTDNLISNLILSYNIWKSLQLKTNLGYSRTSIQETNLSPLNSFNPFTVNPALARTLIQGNNERKSWIIEPQLNYSLNFDDHSIDAIIGTTFQEAQQEGIRLTGTGFSNDLLMEDITAAPSITSTTNFSTYRYTATYARLGYNFKEKYVLNLTGRRDGSSRFGPGKQFGNFGAIGAGWIFSKESIIKSQLPFLSFGKLRASIGKTGNDQLVDYAYLSQYLANAGVYLGSTTLAPLGLTNPFYGWETINKVEAGLDLGFIRDRILLNISIYRNRTENQLVGYSLPYVAGFNTVTANLPAIIENKGLELELNTVNVKKGSFTWTSNFNISVPKNKLVSYPNIQGSSYNQVYVVGQPLYLRFVYKYNGVNPQTGLFTFEDFNKDGAITSDKDKYPLFVGQKFYGGFNNSLSYKGISFDFFIQFVKQNGFNADMNITPGIFTTGGKNQPVSVLDRWKIVGDQAPYQKYTTRFTEVYNLSQNYDVSDAKLTDASFIRLKNIQLAWQIPADLIKRFKIPTIRVYLQGQNLITLTNYKGADPETPQYQLVSALPPIKIFVAGIQLRL